MQQKDGQDSFKMTVQIKKKRIGIFYLTCPVVTKDSLSNASFLNSNSIYIIIYSDKQTLFKHPYCLAILFIK